MERGEARPACGLCDQAEKDWVRGVVSIGGTVFDHASDVSQSSRELDRVTNGDARMKLLVSRYANQQTLAPLMAELMAGNVPVKGPDGRLGIPQGTGTSSYSITRQEDGSIRLDVRYDVEQVTQMQTPDAARGWEIVDTDPEQSHASFAFSLTFAPDYSVTASGPLRFESQIR